jgi:formate hydrogenlyase transcriptional activator
VLRIVVPPLRERLEDVLVLAAHFWRDAASRMGSHATLAPATVAALARYDWPGNVRELQNVVERSAILSPGPVLDVEESLLSSHSPIPEAHSQASPTVRAALGTKERLQEVERSHIISVLRTTDGVVGGGKGAAAILGLHPNTLRSRMKRLGIPSRPR